MLGYVGASAPPANGSDPAAAGRAAAGGAVAAARASGRAWACQWPPAPAVTLRVSDGSCDGYVVLVVLDAHA